MFRFNKVRIEYMREMANEVQEILREGQKAMEAEKSKNAAANTNSEPPTEVEVSTEVVPPTEMDTNVAAVSKNFRRSVRKTKPVNKTSVVNRTKAVVRRSSGLRVQPVREEPDIFFKVHKKVFLVALKWFVRFENQGADGQVSHKETDCNCIECDATDLDVVKFIHAYSAWVSLGSDPLYNETSIIDKNRAVFLFTINPLNWTYEDAGKLCLSRFKAEIYLFLKYDKQDMFKGLKFVHDSYIISLKTCSDKKRVRVDKTVWLNAFNRKQFIKNLFEEDKNNLVVDFNSIQGYIDTEIQLLHNAVNRLSAIKNHFGIVQEVDISDKLTEISSALVDAVENCEDINKNEFLDDPTYILEDDGFNIVNLESVSPSTEVLNEPVLIGLHTNLRKRRMVDTNDDSNEIDYYDGNDLLMIGDERETKDVESEDPEVMLYL